MKQWTIYSARYIGIKMDRREIIIKHWNKVAAAVYDALISMAGEIRENNFTQQLDDVFKEHLVRISESG